MTSDEKKLLAKELLRQKYKELGRLPHKDDFDEPTRSRIKAFLGPWPRALEAAGLKEPRAVPQQKAKKRKKSAVRSENQTVTQRCKTRSENAKANSDNETNRNEKENSL